MITEALAWADAHESPLDRLGATRQAIDVLCRAASADVVAAQRTRVVRELSAEGWSYRRIAAAAGVSPARVQQWVNGEQ